MKKISKTIASVGLSLLAIAAFGQSQNTATLQHRVRHATSRDIKPHHPKLAADTMTLLYNSSDSIQFIGIPISPITIPASARSGYNFCINTIVKGSKMDTVGIWYFSQGAPCGGGDITNARTTVGVTDGAAQNVNTWVTGLGWFNGPDWGGTGAAVTWPETSGMYAGNCIGGNYIWYDLVEAAGCDTAYFPVQDLGLYVSASSNGSNYFIDYENGDATISAAQLFYWTPSLYMNSKYVLGDTAGNGGYSPLTSNAANANLCTNATVAYDTIWDAYTGSFVTPITAGSLQVDTLWPELSFSNASCINDTVIFQICAVTAAGFPNTAVKYGADTLILIAPCGLGVKSINQSGLFVDQNYPNPFNKTTQISYTLTKSSDVTFSVYDMTGRVLINNVYTNSGAGDHTITLSANTFSPGVYFYTFNVNGNKVTKKMVITE
jgi:hypothetical protein